MAKAMKKPTAFIVIKNGNKYLLAKRSKDKTWGCFGGGIDRGETGKDAAIREASEEAGILIEKKELKLLVKTPTKFWFLLNKDVLHSLDMNEEHLKAKYFSKREIRKKLAEGKIHYSMGRVLNFLQ